jgi:hypothetical protein
MGMHFLDLAGLEAVYITKKPVRVEKADLVHFLGFKLHLVFDVHNFHKNGNPFNKPFPAERAVIPLKIIEISGFYHRWDRLQVK